MAKKINRVQMNLKEQPVPEGSHLLEVDNLQMYFHTQDGVVKAVDGVSFHVGRGETANGLLLLAGQLHLLGQLHGAGGQQGDQRRRRQPE